MTSSRPHSRRRRCPEPRGPLPAARALRRCIVVVAAFLIAACSTAPAPGTAAADVAALPRDQRQRLVFDSVWAIVLREHFDSALAGTDWHAARDRLRERAARAGDEHGFYRILGELLAPLGDAHTYVTTPSAVARESARRNAARDDGLGMQLQALEGSVVVTDVQPASAAGRAGVQPGWIVRSWNGIAVDSSALAAGRFGSSRGDTIAVAFADTLETTHEHLLLPTTYAWRHPREVRRDGDVAVVRLTSFEPGMGAWFVRTLDGLRASTQLTRALVIDLRGNPGGQMAELTVTLDALFRDAQTVGRFIARDGRAGPIRLRGTGRSAFDGPVVVLVDRRSGSAAEIFAAVVQGAGRGRVVGERTAGAVLNAFPYRLPDGGRLHVSRRDFRDLCDVRLEHVGVAPIDSADVVHRTLADARRRTDPALARALAVAHDSASYSMRMPRCGS